MTSRQTNAGFVRSLLLLAVAGVVWSLQLWTLLTDRELSSQLWPGDIQASAISLLGGSCTPSIVGGQRCSLAFIAVLLRTFAVMGLCVAGCALRRLVHTPKASAFQRSHGIFSQSGSLVPAAGFSATWLLLWFIAPLLPSDGLNLLLIAAAPATLGLSLALLAAGCTAMLSGSAPAIPDAPSDAPLRRVWFRESGPLLLLLVAAILWQCTSFWMNRRLYDGLLVPHGDSAMYEEHLWNVWHGKGFRSYLDQGLFLGEHIQVIHLLLLPLHMLWPHYLLLEWCSSACLAAAVLPIYSITLRHTQCRRAAFWMGLTWLFFTPMHFLDIAIDLKTLRPSCYGLLALFLFIDQAERGNRWRAVICCLLALMTQEDFALITGSIAGVLFLLENRRLNVAERRRQRFLTSSLAVISAAWVLLAVLVVIPAFRGGEVVHYSRYFGDLGRSPSELLRTAVTEPGRVAAVVFSGRTLLYLLLLTGPLGFLCWKSPLRLAAGLVTFSMLSLIQLGSDSPDSAVAELPPVPFHHFHAPLLPVLFWAAAAGLKDTQAEPSQADSRKMRGQTRGIGGLLAAPRSLLRQLIQPPRRAARFACLCAAGTALTGSLMPCGTAFWSAESPFGWRKLYVPGPRAREFPKVLARLPMSARVASTDFVHTRLTHFERSWDYSAYARAVNNYQLGVPEDTDFIVIDMSHRYSTIRSPADVRELREQPERWELLPDDTGGLFLVLRRRR
ncbi:MAG: hypothetical protein RLZZ436_2758 [Planctomycetota bacterium]|jgi:uncharacterized membrane protein